MYICICVYGLKIISCNYYMYLNICICIFVYTGGDSNGKLKDSRFMSIFQIELEGSLRILPQVHIYIFNFIYLFVYI
jgi:hypothetical protein